MRQDKILNPYNTGYITQETKIKKSSTAETDPSKARVFKISNPNKINPVSLLPVAYKLTPIASQVRSSFGQDCINLADVYQVLLATKDSWHHRRSHFTDAPIWVTKYRDRELFPAGDYTKQGDGIEGIRDWVKRDDNVENEDVVLWHTYTFTHNPRPEDFPNMRRLSSTSRKINRQMTCPL